jgi:hypothetical protein
MNRNLILSIIFLFILSGIGFLFVKIKAPEFRDSNSLVTKISSRIFDLNTLTVENGENLEKEVIKIINTNSGKTVYEKGITLNRIKNEYGWCTFEIYYQDKLIYIVGHFKPNNWNTHDYLFSFEQGHDDINLTVHEINENKKLWKLHYQKIIMNKNGKNDQIIYMDYKKNVIDIQDIKE